MAQQYKLNYSVILFDDIIFCFIFYIKVQNFRMYHRSSSMNFNKILNQLEKLDHENKEIDHKFMTESTLQKKYKLKKVRDLLSYNQVQNKYSNKDQPKSLLHSLKHRYYQDIQKDQVEDARIFGYTTFECLTQFKKNQERRSRQVKCHAKTDINNKPQNGKLRNPLDSQNMIGKQSGSCIPPKTAILVKEPPKRRRLQHKLSLNQIQKAANSGIPLPFHTKQQYFTQQFFEFNNQPKSKQNIMGENFLCGSRSATFHKQLKVQDLFRQSQLKQKNKKFIYFGQKCTKKHSDFQAKFQKFYEKNRNIGQKNTFQIKKYHLDQGAIQRQKVQFKQKIQNHFDNLQKKHKKTYLDDNLKLMESKSIIYEAQRKDEFNVNLSNQNYEQGQLTGIFRHSQQQKLNYLYPASKDEMNSVLRVNEKKNDNLQSQLLQQQKGKNTLDILNHMIIKGQTSPIKKHKLFLFQKQQLQNLKVQPETHLQMQNIDLNFDKLIIKNILNCNAQAFNFKGKLLQHYNVKTISKLPKVQPRRYNIVIIFCVSLQSVIFQNIEITQSSFQYKEKSFSLLTLVKKLLQKHLPKDFVHLMITRTKQHGDEGYYQGQKIKQILVFETFVHNCDLKYFQGRQVQVQYFKYFFKRFMTLDSTIKTKRDIQSSLLLILESEVQTPSQFLQFCQQMKIKDNLNIIALKNSEYKQKITNNQFKCVQISLSKLLLDAYQTVVMIKKQLFEGYDWRGISLIKATKQFRGNHLQHFYI